MIQKVVETWRRVVVGELEALDGLRRHARIRDDRRRQVRRHHPLRWDRDIVKFRVMIWPLQAINAVHEQMRGMLASMPPQLHPDER